MNLIQGWTSTIEVNSLLVAENLDGICTVDAQMCEVAMSIEHDAGTSTISHTMTFVSGHEGHISDGNKEGCTVTRHPHRSLRTHASS